MGKQLENKKSTHLGSSNHEVEILADTSFPIHSPGPGIDDTSSSLDDTSSSSSSPLAFKLSMTNGPHVATRMGFRPLSATTKFSTPPVNVNKTLLPVSHIARVMIKINVPIFVARISEPSRS